jgi:hypothetical protein
MKLAVERKAGLQRESADTLRARRLLADDISLEPAWFEINDQRSRPASQTVIEAIIHCVRERGLAALKEPANIERLSRCDAAAKAQIERRIAKLVARKDISK